MKNLIRYLLDGKLGRLEFKLKPERQLRVETAETFLAGLSKDQKLVVMLALLGRYECLTIAGKAGVGKSHVLQALVDILKRLFEVTVLVVAPTGVASANIGGATIHRAFCLGKNGDLLPYNCRDLGPSARKDTSMIKPKDLGEQDTIVIVDEFSMVSSEVMHIMKDILYNRAEKNVKVKFINFGDPLQALPIKPQRDSLQKVNLFWTEAMFTMNHAPKKIVTYQSLVENQRGWRCINLALITNHRQAEDMIFASALNHIRIGNKLNGPAALIKKRFVADEQLPSEDEAVYIYLSNKKVTSHNNRMVNKTTGKKETYELTVKLKQDGILRSASALKNIPSWLKALNVPMTQELAVGLPFMVRQNDKLKEVYNGTIGVIRQLRSSSIVIELDCGRRVTLETIELFGVPEKRGVPIAKVYGLPGHLACAITAHKAQGLTIKTPMVFTLAKDDYLPGDNNGLIYNVLSRVTKIEHLFIRSSVPLLEAWIGADKSGMAFTKKCEDKVLSLLNIVGDDNTVCQDQYATVMEIDSCSNGWLKFVRICDQFQDHLLVSLDSKKRILHIYEEILEDEDVTSKQSTVVVDDNKYTKHQATNHPYSQLLRRYIEKKYSSTTKATKENLISILKKLCK